MTTEGQPQVDSRPVAVLSASKRLAYFQQRLTELDFSSIDDFFDTNAEAPKHVEDCFPAHISHSLVEMYMEFNFLWHVHLKNSSRYRATRKSEVSLDRKGELCIATRAYDAALSEKIPFPASRDKSCIRDIKAGHESESAVFIRIVEVCQSPQKILTNGEIGVRLIPLNKCPLVGMKNTARYRVIEELIPRRQRETDSASVGAPHSASQAKFVGNVIESGSIILNAVSNDQGQARREWLDHLDVPDWGVVIAVFSDATGVAFGELLQESFESFEVFITPVKFGLRSGKPVRHGDGMISRSSASQSPRGGLGP